MKVEECKVPIQEDHRTFLKKQKSEMGNWKIALIATFLLLMFMSLMIGFTVQSINNTNELRQEVEYLRNLVKDLQKKIDDRTDRDGPTVVTPLKLEGKNDYNDTDYLTYDDYFYDNIPDDYDTADDSEYSDPTSNVVPLTGDQFTKDAKAATPSPRAKRSIIGYGSDGAPINSGYGRNGKSYHFSTPPPTSSFSFYGGSHDDGLQTTTSPRILHSRRLRVDDNAHNIEESSNVDFIEPYGTHTRHRQRRLEFDEHHVRTGRMRPLPAAHFSGDTTKYVLGQHANFHGNGKLRHQQRTFVDWRESSWFHILGMDQHFSMTDGVLTIKDPGLYFIYAQIYYYDEHDINGFRVYKNESETLLQCTTMTHSVEKVMKGNTCFTAGVEHLSENDRISLGDLVESRVSLFEPGKSFFGVIKLGDVKIK